MNTGIAEIINDHLDKLGYTGHVYNVLRKIRDCRTPKMGHHLYECNNEICHEETILYNSCKDRNCPVCQRFKEITWKHDRLEEQLPVAHIHNVFPVPSILIDYYKKNEKDCYNALYKSVNHTLNDASKQSRKFTGTIGYIADLHTHTSKLDYYPHLHVLIPEGGLNKEKNKWKSCKGKNVFNKEKLGIWFKIRLIKNLEKQFKKVPFEDKEIISKLKKKKFKIYTRQSFDNAAEVINYFGNNIYTSPINNDQIKNYDGNSLTFTYIDKRDGYKEKETILDAVLFLKKFSLHILPKRFKRIRYYGFLANNCRKFNLEICKELIKYSKDKITNEDTSIKDKIIQLIENFNKQIKCPCCKKGYLIPITQSTARDGPL